jgi:hypothetical protein
VPVEKFTGYQENIIDAIDGQKYKLRYQICLVQADHEIKMKVPPSNNQDAMIKRLLMDLDKIIDIARTYYTAFTAQSHIFTDMAEFIPDVDVSAMKMNPINRTLYLDENFAKRIGVAIYYVDDNGNPYVEDSS